MSTAPFIDGDTTSLEGGWLVAYDSAGARHYIARIVTDDDGHAIAISPVEFDERLLDMDANQDRLISRLAAAWEADGERWPVGCRLYEMPTEAVRSDYRAREAMAEALHQADRNQGLGASGSWVRDRYMILAEAALRHAADQVGVAVIAPVHAGIRSGGYTISVGYPDDPHAPRGHEQLFRVVATHEPNPTTAAYGG